MAAFVAALVRPVERVRLVMSSRGCSVASDRGCSVAFGRGCLVDLCFGGMREGRKKSWWIWTLPVFQVLARARDRKFQTKKIFSDDFLNSQLIFPPPLPLTVARMHQQASHLCRGCGQYFRSGAGGYVNHLKQSRDPRCVAIRNSVFRLTSHAPHHLDPVLTPRNSPTPPPPTPGCSNAMETEDLDIEMTDIGSEDCTLSPVDHFANQAPEQPTVTDDHSAERPGGLDNLSEMIPHRLPSPILVGSDTDADSSDDGHDYDNDDNDDNHGDHNDDNYNNDDDNNHNNHNNDDHNDHNENDNDAHQLGQESVTLSGRSFSFERKVVYTDYDYQPTRVL